MIGRDNIELRSEKIRNIIGKIPPVIIRAGIFIIFIIVAGLLLGAYFIKYEYIIKTSADVEQRNNGTSIKVKIPANEINEVKQGNTILLNLDNIPNLYGEILQTNIEKIPRSLEIERNGGFYIAEVILQNDLKTCNGNSIKINEQVTVNAKIITGKKSFFHRIIGQVNFFLQK